MKVEARTVHDNPSAEELRGFTEAMPQCRVTEFGNVNVQTRATSRSSGSTYVVAERSSGKTMTREAFEDVARRQDAYLRDKDVIVIDGFIGNDPAFRTRARLTIEKANATISPQSASEKLNVPKARWRNGTYAIATSSSNSHATARLSHRFANGDWTMESRSDRQL